MTTREVNFWYACVRWLPKTPIYFCAQSVVVHSTTGKYGKTVVPELPAMEAIKRYQQDYHI